MRNEEAKKQLLEFWQKSGVLQDKRVVRALQTVHREFFVLPQDKKLTYIDEALPLYLGQTISQPSTVMRMTQALDIFPGARVLEVGTGSGYQSALLATLVGKKGQVVSIEREKRLLDFARKNLKKAKITRVKLILGDGSLGYAKEAPYDRIMVTAAAPTIPLALLTQLKQGGILVIPVGSMYEQEVVRVTKKETGYTTESLGWYRFVPLVGKWGFQKAEFI